MARNIFRHRQQPEPAPFGYLARSGSTWYWVEGHVPNCRCTCTWRHEYRDPRCVVTW